MDICMQFIKEADENIAKIKEIPLYDSVFAESKNVEDVEKVNEESAEKSRSLLKKACDFIADLFRKIKNAIKNFISYTKLSKDEQEKFKLFEEECKNNPEFANKKIRVQDWEKINASYDEVLKKAEDELVLSMRKKEEARPSVLNWLKNKMPTVTGVAKSATIEITVAKAIEKAKKSPQEAEQMLKLIDNDYFYNEQIRKELGNKGYKKTVKKLEQLSSDSKILRFIGGARKNKQKDHEEYRKNLFSEIWTAFKATRRIEKNNPNAKGLTKSAVKIGVDVTKETFRQRRELKRQSKYYDKEIEDIRDEKEKLKKKEKEARKERKEREKKKKENKIIQEVAMDDVILEDAITDILDNV